MPVTSDDRYLMERIGVSMTENELISFKKAVKDRYNKDFLKHLEYVESILSTLSVDLKHAESKLLYSETLQAKRCIRSIMNGMKIL